MWRTNRDFSGAKLSLVYRTCNCVVQVTAFTLLHASIALLAAGARSLGQRHLLLYVVHSLIAVPLRQLRSRLAQCVVIAPFVQPPAIHLPRFDALQHESLVTRNTIILDLICRREQSERVVQPAHPRQSHAATSWRDVIHADRHVNQQQCVSCGFPGRNVHVVFTREFVCCSDVINTNASNDSDKSDRTVVDVRELC